MEGGIEETEQTGGPVSLTGRLKEGLVGGVHVSACGRVVVFLLVTPGSTLGKNNERGLRGKTKWSEIGDAVDRWWCVSARQGFVLVVDVEGVEEQAKEGGMA